MIEFSGYHGGVNNERNGFVGIEKVVEKWSGFLRHGDMGMVAVGGLALVRRGVSSSTPRWRARFTCPYSMLVTDNQVITPIIHPVTVPRIAPNAFCLPPEKHEKLWVEQPIQLLLPWPDTSIIRKLLPCSGPLPEYQHLFLDPAAVDQLVLLHKRQPSWLLIPFLP